MGGVHGPVRRVLLAGGLVIAFLAVLSPSPAAAAPVSAVPQQSWRVDGTVRATAVVGDRLFVGGTFTRATGPAGEWVPRSNLAAFSLSTGALVTGWVADANGGVQALESDGTSLYVGGAFSTVGGVSRAKLAKVSVQDGALDRTFSAAPNGNVRALDRVGEELYVGGAFSSIGGAPRARLAKVSPATGAAVAEFTSSADGNVNDLRRSPDGTRLYVAGNFATLGGSARVGIGVVDATTGQVLPTVFSGSAQPMLDIDLSPDGTRVFGAAGALVNSAIAWDADTGGRQWRQTAMGDVQAIDEQDGVVYFGFHEGFQGDYSMRLLSADALSGIVDTTFTPSFDLFYGVWTITAGPTWLVAGGEFTSVSGVPSQGFVVFPSAGAPSAPPVTLVGGATTWRYWDRGTRPPGWEAPDFDDAAWPTGRAQLGYGDGDEATVVSYGPSASTKYVTTYFRTAFDVSAELGDLSLRLLADDGAVVHLNGREVVRDNMPSGDIGDATVATTGRSGSAESAYRSFPLPSSALAAGRNVLAVEVHQDYAGSSDLSFAAQLTGTGVELSPTPSPTPTAPPVTTESVVVPNGSTWDWRYLPGAPEDGWATAQTHPAGWATGSAVLGFGHSSVVTDVDGYSRTSDRPRAAYFTRTFQVADRSAVTRLVLDSVADDGAVFYVNGVEVARDNMPVGPVTHLTYAQTARSTATAASAPVVVDVPTSLLVSGTNVVAVETHLNYRATKDVTFDLRATLTTIG